MTAKTLTEAVLLNYRSISAFARATGWSYATTYRVVTGVRDPTLPELRTIIRLLEIRDPEAIVQLFHLT